MLSLLFLNGDLQEDIYMQIPEGLRTPENSGMVCKLLKSLYGLKQAPRQWYGKIDQYFRSLGFISSPNDPCLYTRKTPAGIMIIALYVDDLLIFGNLKSDIGSIKSELSKRFEMKDLGPAKTILGIRISRDRINRKLFISQHDYASEVLKRFRMENSRTVSTPMDKSIFNLLYATGKELETSVPYRQVIGSLIYLVSCTRPDLAFTVHRLSQYLETTRQHHWTALKRALRYLHSTKHLGILYDGSRGTEAIGYSDSDFAGCKAKRKSTSGYVFLLAGGAISWKSKKQSAVATSSCEAEYIASCIATKEAIWLSRLMSNVLHFQTPKSVTLYVDNNGAVDLASNATINERTKHIDVQYHFVRQCVQDKKIELKRCDTTNQMADPLTKPLEKYAHEKLRGMQGMRSEISQDCSIRGGVLRKAN